MNVCHLAFEAVNWSAMAESDLGISHVGRGGKKKKKKTTTKTKKKKKKKEKNVMYATRCWISLISIFPAVANASVAKTTETETSGLCIWIYDDVSALKDAVWLHAHADCNLPSSFAPLHKLPVYVTFILMCSQHFRLRPIMAIHGAASFREKKILLLLSWSRSPWLSWKRQLQRRTQSNIFGHIVEQLNPVNAVISYLRQVVILYYYLLLGLHIGIFPWGRL